MGTPSVTIAKKKNNGGPSESLMDQIKQNKLAVAAITTAAVVGAATLYYIYNKKRDQGDPNIQRTFAFIKPDAFSHSDDIMKEILEAGFTIIKSRRITLTQEQASLFYCEHRGKPFFNELINHMTSGPVWALMLERPNAVKSWRDLMGATDPKDAKRESPKCIRSLYGTNITKNAVHGSDSIVSAEREIGFFFDD